MIAALVLASGILLPPEEYRGPPKTPVHVVEGPQKKVDRFCRNSARYPGQRSILACALPGKKLCIIVWPEGAPKRGALWEHELAHCNGWRHR